MYKRSQIIQIITISLYTLRQSNIRLETKILASQNRRMKRGNNKKESPLGLHLYAESVMNKKENTEKETDKRSDNKKA